MPTVTADADGAELLTVAQAAELLGVSERRLRRALALEENAARTVAGTRRTVTGTRRVTVLPPALVADLRAYFERETVPPTPEAERGANGGRNSNTNTAERGASSTAMVLTAGQIADLYERTLQAKDAEIATLKQALEAEREARRDAAQALAREQTLRALEPAQAASTPGKRRPWWSWGARREEKP
jgi:hypothetical protein